MRVRIHQDRHRNAAERPGKSRDNTKNPHGVTGFVTLTCTCLYILATGNQRWADGQSCDDNPLTRSDHELFSRNLPIKNGRDRSPHQIKPLLEEVAVQTAHKMPISAEGLGYSRFTFKPLMDYDTGGCRADVYLPDPHAFTSCPVGAYWRSRSSPCHRLLISSNRKRSALFFHGGAFVFGDTHVILLGHFQYLLDRGFCVVSAEYRMNPQ